MYEAARLEGRMAALVEQERVNLFTQRLGNISASTEVIVELTIDHPLAWISGGWEWRFPTVVAPRYLGGDGTVRDAEAVTVDVVNGATSPTASVTLTIDDLLGVPSSSTHAITVAGQVVTLSNDVALDRDLVIRWPAPHQAPGCTIRTTRSEHTEAEFGDSAFGLLTIVPPTAGGERLARDLVLLLDVSGSMNGRPLQHLKSVVNTLIDSLADDDRLEIIAFSSGQVRYHAEPVHTTEAERHKVRKWIEALKADGGTELISAIGEALRPLRQDVPRQVVIVTDGLIGFEAEAVRAIRDALPAGSRLHTVGVGPASNRAFLRPAARAGRGIEVLIDLDEPATRGAERISAATREPVVMDVVLDGTALLDTPPRLPDLLSGSPVLAPIRLKPQGGTLVVRGRTARGPWEERLDVAVTVVGEGSEAVQVLWARERIEDLELDLACGAERDRIDRRIEQIALQFAVSSRLTSWIAIAEETGDPREPVRTERIPQALPYGMSAEGVGLASAHPMMAGVRPSVLYTSPPPDANIAFAAARSLSLTDLHLRRKADKLRDRFSEIRAAVMEAIARLRGNKTSRDELLARLSAGTVVALRGRVLPTPGRPTATIEIVVTSGLIWRPEKTATLSDRTVDVVELGTTRPGRIVPGSLARLELAAAPDDVRRSGVIQIETGDDVLVVLLDVVE